jgi:hypothetical protein
MKLDLIKSDYHNKAKNYDDYIYSSADVVGLMCLKVLWPVTIDDMSNETKQIRWNTRSESVISSGFKDDNLVLVMKLHFLSRLFVR